MENTPPNDFAALAQELNIPAEKIRNTLELLAQGNTVPFIARFRKDETGGLENDQIRLLQQRAAKIAALNDRRATILKTIGSQNKLTPELEASIQAAATPKLLEDLYLPFKPRKQTLASQARHHGLEPLAVEILADGEMNLEERAAEFAGEGKQVATAADALQGAGHIIAEWYSERADLRQKLRTMLTETGRIVCSRFEETDQKAAPKNKEEQKSKEENAAGSNGGKQQEKAAAAEDAKEPANTPAAADTSAPAEPVADTPAAVEPPVPAADEPPSTQAEPTATSAGPTPEVAPEAGEAEAPATETPPPEASAPEASAPEASAPEASAEETPAAETPAVDGTAESPTEVAPAAGSPADATADASTSTGPASTGPAAGDGVVQQSEVGKPVEADAEVKAAGSETAPPAGEEAAAEPPAAASDTTTASLPAKDGKQADAKQTEAKQKESKQKKAADKRAAAREKKASISKQLKQEAKRKKRQRLEASFKDFFNFNEPVSKLPPHRVLAINRGERVRILKVKFESDTAALQQAAIELLVPAEHPRKETLTAAARDAVTRLVIPALEREIRRELTEQAEVHAVAVFARNLRKLLLQPPVRGKRVLAIDPGFRSGCKLTALDEFGAVLGYAIIHVIGREDRCRQGRAKLVELINQHKIHVVAIGNGAACRETDQLVANVIASELKDTDVRYTIVNEAGASVYSTSAIGREELPTYDAVLRSAVSIGRRLLDPLSELVKINPSNIGVGMYQHDVKATHLRDTLDGVVEACVNYVGVDVNSASPALLRYVSGMNQLTARRVYEHRQNNGPFKTREDLKKVAGLGEQTFEQAAGFLRISSGDNPLDSTWIHPESYDVACKVLGKLDASVEQIAPPAEPKAKQKFGGELIQDEDPQPSADEPAASGPAAADSAAAAPAATEPAAGSETATPGAAASSEAEAVPAADATSEAESSTPPAEQPEAASGTGDAAAAPSVETAVEAPADDTAETTETASLPAAEAATPEAATPEAATPEAATPEAATPEAATPVAATPDASQAAVVDDATEKRAKLLAELATKAAQVEPAKLAAELNIGELLLTDLLAALVRPGRDPREDLPAPDFRRGVMKLEDLEAGIQLTGTVLNVVDFGAFVDIGLSDSGLVHISRLAGHYISDPHDVVSVGDIITVWVVEVDVKRRRVSLTAIQPGTEAPRERPPRQKRPPRKPAAKDGDRPARSGGKRPARGDNRGRDNRRGGGSRSYNAPKKPPKPVKPITKAMEDGKEPMRSFSDLKQLFEKKKDDGKK